MTGGKKSETGPASDYNRIKFRWRNVVYSWGRANTGVSPLNINSTKYDFIKSHGIHGIQGFKNMIMGVPLRNYPGVHYKK